MGETETDKNGMTQDVPVLLLTFNRPEHTRQTIEALRTQRPPVMYVFRDGPRQDVPLDAERCDAVRGVIETEVDWPCELHTEYSETNRGCREAVIRAVSSVLAERESVIVVEDDIVTSSAFYPFMCRALEYYREEKSVFSVSGYVPSGIPVPDDYAYDVYCSPRLFNWGWGTWRDRWNKVDWSMGYYDRFMRDSEQRRAFARGGEDLLKLLREEREGKSSAWDIRFAFAHFRHHAVSIVPVRSYTRNIGMDGSGTHCVLSAGSGVIPELNDNPNPVFLDTLYYDRRIVNALCNRFSAKRRPLWKKACNYMARKLGRPVPFPLKDKVYC